MAGENERLRDAFAQLLAMNQREVVPAEAVWAAQGRQQLPQPQPDPTVERFSSQTPDITLPMRQFTPDPSIRAAELMPKNSEPPFGGKGEVVGEYKPPEKKKNKKKGKD
jgi:hypothetical protein